MLVSGLIDENTAMNRATKYSFEETLVAAQRINWRIEDLIGGDKQLDFRKPFLPESLARIERLDFLDADEKRVLNQIKGHTYLAMFGLVEEFILPFVLDHVRPALNGDDYRVRAFLQFASEEAKHIQLFKRFTEEFHKGFPTECAVIGPAAQVAEAVLSHDPLAVALIILHIEWMTQRHYVESVKDNQTLDAQFRALLKNHWLEEAQHAKLDAIMVEVLAEAMNGAEIERAIDEYLEIVGFLDDGLRRQAKLDLEAFERATGRKLAAAEREEFIRVQHQANRWTYLGTGMTHPNFTAALRDLKPKAEERVRQLAPVFC